TRQQAAQRRSPTHTPAMSHCRRVRKRGGSWPQAWSSVPWWRRTEPTSPLERESRDADHIPWSEDSWWRFESCAASFPQVALGSDCTSALGPHSAGRIEFEMRCIILQRLIHGVRSRRWGKEYSMNLERKLLQSLPKVLLHEHLDGV